MLRSYMIVEGDDVILDGDIGCIWLSEYTISNRMNKTIPIAVSWTGDSPEADVWTVSIPDEISPNSDLVMLLRLQVQTLCIEQFG